MCGTTVASLLACRAFKLVPCKVTITPYFCSRIMTTGFLTALSFQAGNTAYLYLSGKHMLVSWLAKASGDYLDAVCAPLDRRSDLPCCRICRYAAISRSRSGAAW